MEDKCWVCVYFWRKHLSRWMTWEQFIQIMAAGGKEASNMREGLSTVRPLAHRIDRSQAVRYEAEVHTCQKSMIWPEEQIPFLSRKQVVDMYSRTPLEPGLKEMKAMWERVETLPCGCAAKGAFYPFKSIETLMVLSTNALVNASSSGGGS